MNKRSLPKYVTETTDRHGKTRYRCRKNGQSTYLKGIPYSDEFMAEYHEFLSSSTPERLAAAQRKKPKKGTIEELCIAYLKSSTFKSLRYPGPVRRVVDQIRDDLGTARAKDLKASHVYRRCEGIAGEAAKNNYFKRVSALWTWSKRHGYVDENPLLGMPKPGKEGTNHAWTPNETSKYLDGASVNAKLAVQLLLYTGQRSADVRQLTWNQINFEEAQIEVTQQKTGKKLWISMHPKLVETLSQLERRGIYVLLTNKELPYTEKGFYNLVKRDCLRLGLNHCCPHGLRHSASIGLAEAGCTVSEIAAITGMSIQMVQRYTVQANRKQLSENAMRKLAGSNAEQ